MKLEGRAQISHQRQYHMATGERHTKKPRAALREGAIPFQLSVLGSRRLYASLIIKPFLSGPKYLTTTEMAIVDNFFFLALIIGR